MELSATWISVCETFQEHNWPIKYFRSPCFFFILSNLSYLLLTGRVKPLPLLAMMTSMLKGTEQRQKSKHIFKATCL